jgi:hypothetical protein
MDNSEDIPVTQVGSAFHRIKEIYMRLGYLEENPSLIMQRPDVYIGLCNELSALFTDGCDRDAWFWYSRNSDRGLGE